MTDIHFNELDHFLQEEGVRGAPSWPPVCLLFGEEVLYKKALEKVLAAILGDAPRNVNYEPVDGSERKCARWRWNVSIPFPSCPIAKLWPSRMRGFSIHVKTWTDCGTRRPEPLRPPT